MDILNFASDHHKLNAAPRWLTGYKNTRSYDMKPDKNQVRQPVVCSATSIRYFLWNKMLPSPPSDRQMARNNSSLVDSGSQTTFDTLECWMEEISGTACHFADLIVG